MDIKNNREIILTVVNSPIIHYYRRPKVRSNNIHSIYNDI